MSACRPGIPGMVLLSFLLFSCAHLPERAGGLPAVSYVERDAEWSGEIRIDGIVHVRKNATLRILPGTRVVFGTARFPSSGDEHEGFSAPGIRVDGRIVALGTAEAPILFTSSSSPPGPGSWDKILFTFSNGNRFLHCTFEGARYAFHAHFSGITVGRCVFRGNEEGVRLGGSRVTIEDSVFTGNEVRGINFRECRNILRRNLVYGNGDGIFLHSKDSGSVIRENALYANRGYDVRLGDLHADDIDLSGNWWGTAREEDASRRIYDGRSLAGLGKAGIAPVLARPPVTGGAAAGIFTVHLSPVSGGSVAAYATLSDGLWGDGYVGRTDTDENGRFLLPLPPGRYFIVGSARSSAGPLFAFPGRNPVVVRFGETTEVGLPAVVSPPAVKAGADSPGRTSVLVRTTLSGVPVPGVSVQAAAPDAPDLRGPGKASSVTGDDGVAALRIPPGKYLLSARKRTAGAAVGMVEEGGLFGIYPYSPLELAEGKTVSVEIPLFEKRGLLSGEETDAPFERADAPVEGSATMDGRPASGYIAFFYPPGEPIGRPVARSSASTEGGGFTVLLPRPGDYDVYLRRSESGLPGGAQEERIGPVRVHVTEGRLPLILRFRGRETGS